MCFRVYFLYLHLWGRLDILYIHGINGHFERLLTGMKKRGLQKNKCPANMFRHVQMCFPSPKCLPASIHHLKALLSLAHKIITQTPPPTSLPPPLRSPFSLPSPFWLTNIKCTSSISSGLVSLSLSKFPQCWRCIVYYARWLTRLVSKQPKGKEDSLSLTLFDLNMPRNNGFSPKTRLSLETSPLSSS